MNGQNASSGFLIEFYLVYCACTYVFMFGKDCIYLKNILNVAKDLSCLSQGFLNTHNNCFIRILSGITIFTCWISVDSIADRSPFTVRLLLF